MPDYLDADGNFDREAWLNAEVRPERDSRIEKADARIRRFENQYHACLNTDESVAKIQELREYMQELRDIPATAQPDSFEWPSIP